MSAEPTPEVIALARAGSEPELTQVLRYLYQVVGKHIGFSTSFAPHHQDVTQEALIELYAAFPGYRGEGSLRAWALRIAGRVLHRYARPRRHHAMPLTESGELDAQVPAEFESAADLARLLERLTPKKREAFVLMEVCGLTAKEAGVALGTFANTAASRCRHARAELEKMIADDEMHSRATTVESKT